MKINDNVEITTIDDTIYLMLKRHQRVVISAEDKYRKGVEINFCSECQTLQPIVGWENDKAYCGDCSYEETMRLKKED